MKNRHSRREMALGAWIFVIFIVEIALIVAVNKYFTAYGEDKAYDTACDIMNFVYNRIKKYDYYKEDDNVKSLYELCDKAKELDRYIKNADEDYADIIKEYADEEDVDGILVFDKDMKCEYQVYTDLDAPNEEIPGCVGRILENISSKNYMSRTAAGSESYDFAAISSENRQEVLVLYKKTPEDFSYEGSISMDSLITGFSFQMDGVAVITDGNKIVNTNADKLQGKSVEELKKTSGMAWEKYSDKLICIQKQDDSWYGIKAKAGKYDIYAFLPEETVFEERKISLVLATFIYAASVILIILMRQYMVFKDTKELEKQYRIVRSVSSMYLIALIIDIADREWEIVRLPDEMSREINRDMAYEDMIDELLLGNIEENNQKDIREFLNLDTIPARLKDNPYISCVTEDKDGRWYVTMLIPHRTDSDGNVKAAILLARDVTTSKKTELMYQKQLIESAHKAEMASEAKTNFLRRMSHDMRTPINGIRGMVDICRFNINDKAKQQECMDKIMSASGFLMDLVNDVLDMNKLETGEVAPEETVFSLGEVIGEVNGIIEVQARKKGISYQAVAENYEYDSLIGSSLHFRQILQNILSNALKYNTENGSVRHEITQEKTGADTVWITFVCEDTGVGMSEEFQKKAYDPFAQENETARTSYEGTGLGLAITKKLADMMGGTIEFTSKRGVGTKFTIRLPFRINNKDLRETEYEETSFDIENENALKGMTVLVAEDNEINMEITKFILETSGAKVCTASDGREAVEIFEKSPLGSIDAILMDIMMPVMDGMRAAEVIRSLDREDSKKVIIIAMSANAFSEDVSASLASGMDMHIAKPVDRDAVVAGILKLKSGGSGVSRS